MYMRLFIAYVLPDEIKKELDNIKRKFKEYGKTTHDAHITIKFLGDFKMKDFTLETKKFKASIKNLSFFPNENFIRIVHSPVNKGYEMFVNLHKEVCKKLGVEVENYVPHTTIARIKKKCLEVKDIAKKIKFEYEFFVEKICLFNSTLTPNGPIYKKIKEYPLRKN